MNIGSHTNQLKNSLRNSDSVGRTGELFVQNFLTKRGFTIHGVNVRCKFAEIDLIVSLDTDLYFVEVKSSTKGSKFPIRERFDEKKYFKIMNCANLWLHKNNKYEKYTRTILLILVSYDGKDFSVANITEVRV